MRPLVLENPRGASLGCFTTDYDRDHFRHAFNTSNGVCDDSIYRSRNVALFSHLSLHSHSLSSGSGHAVVAADGADFGPVPRLFLAVTVQTYDFPGVAPVTVIGLAVPALVTVAPPFEDVQLAV